MELSDEAFRVAVPETGTSVAASATTLARVVDSSSVVTGRNPGSKLLDSGLLFGSDTLEDPTCLETESFPPVWHRSPADSVTGDGTCAMPPTLGGESEDGTGDEALGEMLTWEDEVLGFFRS